MARRVRSRRFRARWATAVAVAAAILCVVVWPDASSSPGQRAGAGFDRLGRSSAVCEEVKTAIEGLRFRCPGWLPSGSGNDHGFARMAVSGSDLDPTRCGYLAELTARSGSESVGLPDHVLFGGRCGPLPLKGRKGYWPSSPRLAGYLGLVGIRSQMPGGSTERRLVAPRIVRRVRIGQEGGLLLAVAPYPDGGLHGGHYALVWNSRGDGYTVSLHYPRGDQRRPPTARHERILKRVAESMA